MKRSALIFLPLLALTAGIAGCGEANEGPTPVAGYETYTDPLFGFEIRRPTNWAPATQVGAAVFYSSRPIAAAFSKFEPGAERGGKIEIRSFAGGQAGMSASIDSLKNRFDDKSIFKPQEQVQLNGTPGTKITYGFEVGTTNFMAERIYVVKDTVVTYLETAVFGDYAAYASIFDSVRAAFKPGVLKATAQSNDTASGGTPAELVSPPAADATPYSGKNFSVSIPSNFSPNSKSGGLENIEFFGERRDSYISVQVSKSESDLAASVSATEKSGKYGKARPTKLGGQNAFVFSYSPQANVSSRVYFAKSGNKLYQVTLIWFKPQSELYLPAFEKVISSFRMK